MDIDQPESPKPALIERTIDNASTALRTLLPGGEVRSVHHGVGDVLIAAALLLGVHLVALAPGRPVFLLIWDLQIAARTEALFVFVICLVAWIFGRHGLVPGVLTGAIWAMVLGRIGALIVEQGFGLTNSLTGDYVTLGLTAGPAILFVLAVLGPIVGGIAGLAGLAALLIVSADLVPLGQDSEGAEATPQFAPETLFAAQGNLLRNQLDAIRPGIPGEPELFAILGAGHPYQGVFRREVDAVHALLASGFGAKDRSVTLINSEKAPLADPLLTRSNLGAAVRGMRALMQPEDILLLFLTSHGRPEQFDTVFAPYIPYALTPENIADALEQIGEQPAILIISACYSGSFSSALAAPNRLVITAADADSVSFGCDDQSEWTEWGRAFWVDALSETKDPRGAARIAKGIVASREAEQDLPPSDPMIIEGAAVGLALDGWLKTLDGR